MQLTLLFAGPDGHPRMLKDQAEVEAALAAKPSTFWLDLEAPDPESVTWLSQRFNFHPLPLEDLLQVNLRPKLETYDGYVFLICHAVTMGAEGTESAELQCFLSHEYLVTVHNEPSPILQHVYRLLAGEAVTFTRGPDHVLYLLLAAVADSYFDAIDVVDDQIDELEERVLTAPGRETLDAIFSLRHSMALMRRYASPLRDALDALLSNQGGFIRAGNEFFIRDVRNQMVTVHEMVESQRDLTAGVLDAYLSHTSNRLNDVMKRLTVVANIFMPISFVAGVFGTNFRFMPYDDPLWFALFIAVLVGTPAAMLFWFRREGWV